MLTRQLYESCPLCREVGAEIVHVADCSRYPSYQAALSPVMTWLRCPSCEHVYVDGIYTDEAMAVLFRLTHEAQKVGFDAETQRYVSARMIEKVLPYATAGHWLDIGFGNASLLLTAQEYGFIPVGIDLRQGNVEALRGLGVEAHAVDLAQFEHAEPFKVISMCDVLEHVPFPAQSLERAHALLDTGGVLFLSMPNSESAVWRALDAQGANPYWAEMEHYHNFSRTRLYRLLRECRFEPVRYGISERYRACMEVIARKVARA